MRQYTKNKFMFSQKFFTGAPLNERQKINELLFVLLISVEFEINGEKGFNSCKSCILKNNSNKTLKYFTLIFRLFIFYIIITMSKKVKNLNNIFMSLIICTSPIE